MPPQGGFPATDDTTGEIPVSSYFHPVRVPGFQEGRWGLIQMCISHAPAMLNSSALAHAVVWRAKGPSPWWPSPHSQLSIRSSKLICQLIWQRLNFQLNQQTMYTVCFNWVKLRNGRARLTLHKKVHGNLFGTNSVFKLNCISAMSQEYPNATCFSPNSF